MTIHLKIALAIIITLLANTSPSQAQKMKMMKQPTPVDKKERSDVIKAISQQLEDNYVFPDMAKKMTAFIKKQQKKGKYRKITDTQEFADVLSKDLISVSDDKHISVRFNPEGIARQKQAVSEEEQEKLQQRQVARMRTNNFGFQEIKILDGNVGYLNLRGFIPAEVGGDTAIAAMNFLSNTDAIIFDLRQNGGGDPSMVQLISSYLFDEPAHLTDIYYRPTDLTTQSWTLPYVPGKRSPDTPVYILTSSRTFSAAEEFSYNLKNLKRATIVGETTGGGAHPGGTVDATDRYQVWLPSGRAINPITKTNWEGTGVSPHIAVTQAEALTTAHIDALKKLSESNEDEQQKNIYNWALNGLKARGKTIDLTESLLASYAGKYGPRMITMQDGRLSYQREGGRKYTLKAMSDNMFMLEGLSAFRIKFESKEDKVVALIGLYDDGNSDKNLRN